MSVPSCCPTTTAPVVTGSTFVPDATLLPAEGQVITPSTSGTIYGGALPKGFNDLTVVSDRPVKPNEVVDTTEPVKVGQK